jgi:hypothetical protein
MTSNTSSEISGLEINNEKPPTTTTFHLDHLANDAKTKEPDVEPSSKISDISEASNNSNDSSVSGELKTSGINMNSPRNNSPVPQVDSKFRKIELLKKLLDLKEKGFKLTKTYDCKSSLEEMEYEYEVLKRYADKRNGLKIARNLLINSVSILEFMNNSYNPIDFQLEGWAEHTQVEIDNYDDVLEELWEKYKMTGKRFSPEIRLVFMLTASAAAYHFTKSHTKKTPNQSFINPSMVAGLFKGNKPPPSKYVTPQELNIQRQQELDRVKKMNENKFTNNYQSVESANIDIAAPSDVDSILKKTQPSNDVKSVLDRLHSDKNDDRLVSESNVSTKPKRGRGRPRKDQNI